MITDPCEPDDSLFRRSRSRDGDAARVLMGRHTPSLRRVVGRMFSAYRHLYQDIDDVVQSVFLELFRLPADREWTVPIANWLVARARLRAKDHLRRHFRREIAVGADPTNEGNDPFAGIPDREEVAPDPDGVASLRDCINHLNSTLREVFHLRYWDESGFEEIAERFGVATSTAWQWLNRADALVADCVRRRLGRNNPLTEDVR